MNRKYLRTVEKIFKGDSVKWSEAEGLLTVLGAQMSEGSGSRKRCNLNGVKLVLHKPHPGNELNRGAVKSLKKYLIRTDLFDENGDVK